MIDYTKFCIFLPESTILADPDYDLFGMLESISAERIAELRYYGGKAKRHFTYQQGMPLPGDAFDVMVGWNHFLHQSNADTDLDGAPSCSADSSDGTYTL